ncbi:MAG TPA: hypothetical protein VGH20_13480 [Myxococcales bacterium]|jgi:hypothetical protein
MLAILLAAAAATSPGARGARQPLGTQAARDPAKRARQIARGLPWANDAMLELRREAGKIEDPGLRAATETQILAPWMPRETWALAHLQEARKLLGDPGLTLPPPDQGDFAAAPGGECETGHHGYPGGLAVHALANLLHGRALAILDRHLYKTEASMDFLAAAAIWQDSMKAATLPWKPDGSCGPEAAIAGAPAHVVLGLATAISRHLPKELLFVIGSAGSTDLAQVCRWVKAASILAVGHDTECLAKLPLEAYLMNAANASVPLAVAAWTSYVRDAPRGWARFDALLQDGNDVAFYQRSR